MYLATSRAGGGGNGRKEETRQEGRVNIIFFIFGNPVGQSISYVLFWFFFARKFEKVKSAENTKSEDFAAIFLGYTPYGKPGVIRGEELTLLERRRR